MAKNNYSSWIFLGAALLAGAGAFWLSHIYLKSQEAKLRSEVTGGKQTMVQVVVAASNLPAGSIVSASTMSLGRLPKAYVSPRFVTAARFDSVQGHAIVRAKAAGEPLLLDDVGGVFVERFSDLLKPGERAVTLEASDINSNAGMLLPGDHIDLYLLSKDTGTGQDSQSLVPLLEDVHVLAAGQEALRAQDQKYLTLKNQNSRYDTITVSVSVDDAEKLVLARKAGDLAYLLRNSGDQAKEVATRLSMSQLGVGGGVVGMPAANSNGVDMYEYYSINAPSGILKSYSVPTASVAAAPGGAGIVDSAGAPPAGPAQPPEQVMPSMPAQLDAKGGASNAAVTNANKNSSRE